MSSASETKTPILTVPAKLKAPIKASDLPTSVRPVWVANGAAATPDPVLPSGFTYNKVFRSASVSAEVVMDEEALKQGLAEAKTAGVRSVTYDEALPVGVLRALNQGFKLRRVVGGKASLQLPFSGGAAINTSDKTRSATIVVVSDDGTEVLCAITGRGLDLIGGGCDSDSIPQATAVTELAEEAGLVVSGTDLVWSGIHVNESDTASIYFVPMSATSLINEKKGIHPADESELLALVWVKIDSPALRDAFSIKPDDEMLNKLIDTALSSPDPVPTLSALRGMNALLQGGKALHYVNLQLYALTKQAVTSVSTFKNKGAAKSFGEALSEAGVSETDRVRLLRSVFGV